MDKSYRIHTNISSDTVLNVNMQQDFDFLEVLSLKLRQKDAYRLHSSNYGVIIGRVLANDAFGIPNAKVSIFIERDGNDSSDIEAIYPYKEVTTKDKEGRRYNLLPDYSDDDCYRVVGTFPNKRLMLDDDIQLEVYEKYWKYTTVTNNAGDYMLFGVPTGSVTVHIDMDLSDVGVLSQKPRDFEYKGYNLTLFDSPNQFKESTNLDDLAQIFSQNKSVFVYPFWGDADNGIASLTRADIQIQYKFEPTCVFMGSIVSDNEGHAIGHKCAPDVENGMNDQLVGGSGTIEMIRKTTDGLIEEYQIQGNQLIDENGVWCYQIPMNLDYIGTDEYGNVVPTDNPTKGIPTRAQVRFRISKNETSDEGFSRHTAKYLVPMNPIFSENKENIVDMDEGNGGRNTTLSGEIPVIPERGSDIEKMYTFGSSTPISCFRDLYWNNVYSVKNYIPKTQVAHRAYAKNYSALKGSNLAENQNPIPFNKLRIDLPFLYMIVCIIFTMIVYIVWFINYFIICTIDDVLSIFWRIKTLKILWVRPFGWLPVPDYIGCISLSAGISEGNVAYYPGCRCKSGLNASDCPSDMEGDCEKSTDTEELLDKIQRNLALEFKIIKLDLYQDWVNGCLYMPLWYWRKRKKKTFLFFTLSGAKNEYCSDSRLYSRLKTYVTCNIKYVTRSLGVRNNRESMPDSEDRWHKNRAAQVRYKRGLIKPVENKDGLTAYYYAALQATSDNANDDLEMVRRAKNFKAVRLFATDIILLGNLDPKNIYGIPQFFKCLPATTANIPPIATIEETINPNEKEKLTEKDAGGEAEDSGTTITTGMDWNHNGDRQSPRYKTGLFMDLACTYAGTKPKSCINVERISELGVSVDMTHNMAYHEGGTDTQYGQIDSDGFITKYELDDMENRAMFATLNHIGFIPQEYQDSISGYTTQVQDRNTNYLVPKFKYIYPVDFDGRMQLPMDLYKNGFEQATFDEKDESYLTFRLGAENSDEKDKNSEGRIRHFYHRYSESLRDMPLYNNSYYFYFGIKKGSTAIDKFNEMFYAPCFKRDKKPFTLEITTQGKSYCPDVYTGACNGHIGNVESAKTYEDSATKNNAYGFIRVKSDDIRAPYKYTLYDSYGDIVISEDEMTMEEFVIGGTINKSGDTILNCNGEIRYQKEPYERIEADEDPESYYNAGLKNQEYVLEVVDSDGKKISEKIKLDIPKIVGHYEATKLGAKFYNSATTRIDYICHDYNSFYGMIKMTGFTVDGYYCELKDIQYLGYSKITDDTNGRYVFCVTGKSADISDNVIAYIELMVFKSSKENLVRNCLCDNNSSINLVRAAQGSGVDMNIKGANKNEFFLGFDEAKDEGGNITGTPTSTIYIYQPNRYEIRITQGCPDCSKPISANSSTEIINVQNGEPFITKLNTMPTKFMLGTVNDNVNAEVANTSYFYYINANISGHTKMPNDYNLKGWYGTHQEDSYMFSRREENKTYMYNQMAWEDLFKNVTDDVASPGMKRTILKFKFDAMFALSEGAYITKDSSRRFTFEATGGVSPILYRTVAPTYDDNKTVRSQYILDDFFTSECNEYIPNIVGINFSDPENEIKPYYDYRPGTADGPHFNDNIYSNATFLGNYFAAFTRDGSYISKKKIDGINIAIERSPSFASISPIDGSNSPKVKGKDVKGGINTFSLVHSAGDQTLEGDITRNTLPYVRALYVDRRFDFDLTVLAPVVGSNFSLYKDKDRNRPWKGGRISGWTYNGIEMSYDQDYNVISAHTYSADTKTYAPTGEDLEGTASIEYTAATFNKRLEYTYKYDCADICVTCGYQKQNMGEVCQNPSCNSNNINHFHGEIGDNVTVRKAGGIEYKELSSHKVDDVNFYANQGYTLDDAVTYYHTYTGNSSPFDWGESEPRWGNWNSIEYNGKTFGFNSSIDEDQTPLEKVPLIKEFYSSEIAGVDIRHLYWSKFNRTRLDKYTSGGTNQQYGGHGKPAIDNFINPFYVYRYPLNNQSLYNGDFNREDAINGSYPTKRYLDIGNLPSTSFYNYYTQCCSYAMEAVKNDDGTITAETDAGEEMEINLNWVSPITVISPNADSKEYANVVYKPYECKRTGIGICINFSAGTASIMFKYNSFNCDDFEVYTKPPKLIKVLPYIEGKDIDGIGYYKTANQYSEFGGYGDGKTLDGAIEDITLLTFDNCPNGVSSIWDFIRMLNEGINVITPNNVGIKEGYTTKIGVGVDGKFFYKESNDNKDWLLSNDNDFTNITFSKENIPLNKGNIKKTKAFTILVDREYRYEYDDNLVRHLRTIETSDIYDCRDLLMKITVKNGSLKGEENHHGTYVQLRKSAATPITGVTSINSETGRTHYSDTAQTPDNFVTDVEAETGKTGEDSTKIYVQTITFDMYFDTSDSTEIPDRQNEAFANYGMMSYVFRFTNVYNEQFDVSPSEVIVLNAVDHAEFMVVRFILKWPTNMGILADKQWCGSAPNLEWKIPVVMFARTQSNFIYKLNEFKLEFCCGEQYGQEGFEPRCPNNPEDIDEAKDGMDDETKRYYSHVRIGWSKCSCDCE